MPYTKPFHRIWLPMKGYNWINEISIDSSSGVTINYLNDDLFANQSEKRSLFNATRLILLDLFELFDYIEPTYFNRETYSHRIYELLLRTATEFEANCKGILQSNGYSRGGNWNNKDDYFRIEKVAKLSSYKVAFYRWDPYLEFQPFAAWSSGSYSPLPWYQGYNAVKHDRYSNFAQAKLENLMNAIAGLVVILHAQYGTEMASVGFRGLTMHQSEEGKVSTDIFGLEAPSFAEADQYEFIWNSIKTGADPVQNYQF